MVSQKLELFIIWLDPASFLLILGWRSSVCLEKSRPLGYKQLREAFTNFCATSVGWKIFPVQMNLASQNSHNLLLPLKKKTILVPDLGKHPGHLRLLGSLFKQNQHLLSSQGTKQWGTGNTFRTGAARVQSCGGQKVPWHKHCQAQPAGKHLPDHQMYTVLTKKFKYSSLSKATAQN